MLALVSARKSYIVGANGILNNGDRLAALCGQYTREQTVTALVKALKLPGNPYLALNPGQQSMNLRNKARNALKNGTLTLVEVSAAYDDKAPVPTVAPIVEGAAAAYHSEQFVAM